MNELERLRTEIDGIDKELLPLFLKRMAVCSQVADYKRKVGMAVLDAEREAEVLQNKMTLLEEYGQSKEMQGEVYEFFRAVMAISRVRQTRELTEGTDRMRVETILASKREPVQNPTVCFFGSEGSYSEEAAIRFFGDGAQRISARTFTEAFSMLGTEQADYLVLPIENSSTGTIADVTELLLKHGYFIVGEEKVGIRHCLLGVPGAKLSDIKTVYSHEQGILQCREFLHTLGDVRCEEYYSTALSAKAVAQKGDVSCAAIAARRNAELLGLSVLAEGINNSAVNTTRFAVIATRPEISPSCDKVSIAFTLPHESGQLHRLLACFAQAGLNLLKLESRPLDGKPFEYMFFADYSGNLLDDTVRTVTDSVIEGTQEFTLLGNYKGKDTEAAG